MTDDFTSDSFAQPVDETDQRAQTFSCDESGPQSVGLAIIQAVASVTDTDPLSLQPRLYDVIDPDALERLVSADNSGLVRISFEFGEHMVTVTNNRNIVVYPLTGEQ